MYNFFELWQKIEEHKLAEAKNFTPGINYSGQAFYNKRTPDHPDVATSDQNVGRTTSDLLHKRTPAEQLAAQAKGAKAERLAKSAEFNQAVARAQSGDPNATYGDYSALAAKLIRDENKNSQNDGEAYQDELRKAAHEGNTIADMALSIDTHLRKNHAKFGTKMKPASQFMGDLIREFPSGGITNPNEHAKMIQQALRLLSQSAGNDLFVMHGDNIGVKPKSSGQHDVEDVGAGNRGNQNVLNRVLKSSQALDHAIAKVKEMSEKTNRPFEPSKDPNVVQHAADIVAGTEWLIQKSSLEDPDLQTLHQKAHDIITQDTAIQTLGKRKGTVGANLSYLMPKTS